MALMTSTVNRRMNRTRSLRSGRRHNAASAMVVISILMGVFVYGNYQNTNPPSCGSTPVGNFMTISSTHEVRACAAGEQPVQVGFVDSLHSTLGSLIAMLPATVN